MRISDLEPTDTVGSVGGLGDYALQVVPADYAKEVDAHAEFVMGDENSWVVRYQPVEDPLSLDRRSGAKILAIEP